MAAKKIAKKVTAAAKMLANARKKKKRKHYYRIRHHRVHRPEERVWMSWNHDVDTILHELVKNPKFSEMAPKDIVARAEAFADALHELQNRRRPKGVTYDGRY